MISNSSLIAALVSVGTTALLCSWLANSRSRLQILDHPNERSLHEQPTPRTGGIGIVLGVAIGWLIVAMGTRLDMPRELNWLSGAAVLIAFVSFLDDRRHLAVRFRLGVHLLVAVLLVVGGLELQTVPFAGVAIDLPWGIAELVTVLLVVWMTNLYNFMDGMDGFAGGMAVFGFGTLSLLGGLAQAPVFAGLNLIVAAAAGGFLILNFPPARIFMGDTGSTTLGFLAAGIALWGENAGIVPLWVSMILFLPFVADATVTLIRRLLQGDRVWQAHRTHFYQRLVQAGWSHRRTVLVEYGLMAICSGMALLAVRSDPVLQAVILTGSLGLMATFFWLVCRLEKRRGLITKAR